MAEPTNGQSGGRSIYQPQVVALLRERGFDPEQVAEVEVRQSYYGKMELGYVKLKRPPVPPLARSGEHTPSRGPSEDPQ